jgi:hypothetical protein
MSSHQYVILTSALPGKLEEFERWYDNQHLPDVVRVPGIKSAKRYRLKTRIVTPDTFEAPAWSSLAIYEFDSDDPVATAAQISALAGTAAMPATEAIDPEKTLKIVAEFMAEFPPAATE